MKVGFKKTEAGVIPVDWDVLPFERLASIERGKFSARPRNDPKYYGGEIPFIQTGDVTRSGGSITSFTQTLNSDGLRVSKLFPIDTLYFTIAANIGDVGIARFEAACPDSLVAITPTPSIDKQWLLFELARRKSDFESLASPGAQLNINLEKLRPYLLPVPPTKEQTAIAELLSDAGAMIEGLQRLIKKRSALKQAAMQQLLTKKTRISGFNGNWHSKQLKHVAEISTGINKPLGQMGYGALYVTVQDLYEGTSIRTERLGRINVSQSEVNAKSLAIGDVVFGKSSVKREGIGYPSRFLGADEPVILSGFTYRARARTGVADPAFLFYALRAEGTRKWLIDNSQSSALTNINQSIADAIPVQIPPTIDEQREISSILLDMDAELISLEAQLAKAQAIKQGMMQELLTGQTRLT
jgi:type I restriction enzyme S subunit